VNILHNICQGTQSRNYLVYVRAPTWSLIRRRGSISLVLETRRSRSARVALRILNILRPLQKVRMIPLTIIIGFRMRIIG